MTSRPDPLSDLTEALARSGLSAAGCDLTLLARGLDARRDRAALVHDALRRAEDGVTGAPQ